MVDEAAPNDILARAWRPLVLLAALAIIVLRAPILFTEPRFWAEEGSGYFSAAYRFAHSPEWFRSLGYVHRGYLAIWTAGATTVAANLVPLERAPLVTTLFALIAQIGAIAVILWTDSEFWRTPLMKLVGVLVILFVPLSGEIWLNTINSQFVFGLIAFLILQATPGESPVSKWLTRALLLIAGLTGIVSCLLAPFFILRARLERSRERAVQAAILTACALIQLFTQFVAWTNNASPISLAPPGFDWQTFVAIFWTQSMGLMLSGLERIQQFPAVVTAARSAGNLLFFLGLLGIELLFLWAISARLRLPDRLVFIGSYLVLMFVSIVGAVPQNRAVILEPGPSQRYFFTPNAILILAALASVAAARSVTTTRAVAAQIGLAFSAAALIVSIFWGMAQFKETTWASPDWPRWRQNLALWRENPAEPIEIWPPGWMMWLKDGE